MITDKKLRSEIREHYPRMTGQPAYRAEVLADLNGVHESTVYRIMLSEDLLDERDRNDITCRLKRFERRMAMAEALARLTAERAQLARA